MIKSEQPGGTAEPCNDYLLVRAPHESDDQAMARSLLEPHLRHSLIASTFAANALGRDQRRPPLMAYVEHFQDATRQAEIGELAVASRLLASQAITLDSIFVEFSRRSALNLGSHLEAAERYLRLALKAQSNCRATLEALAKLHQPREQTVRHVHVGGNGQAIIADEFHHHAGGLRNAETAEQPHAPEAISVGDGSTMPSKDAQRLGLPVSVDQGREALSDARRQG